jgi:dephospho-CoA kinase
MLTIALTGNVAAGKSRVAELFQRWGATLIDADRLVHEVQAPGTPVFQAIANRFGPEVVAGDGALDRARLRAIVLADPAARRELEAIVHPAIHRRREELLAEARRRGDRVVVCDIPLLFETMDPAAFDRVVLVDAPEAVRLDRLVRLRGMDAAEARQLMQAQQPAAEKRRWRGPRGQQARVIENDGDLAALESRARRAWEELTQGIAD